MVFCLSTISQQWIYGGGCTWYFVPLSTLTSHSRWSKKLRDTSSLWWKSPEKNFLLPPKGPFVSHLVRPSATDINVDQQKKMQNINKTPPLCSAGLSLSVYNKNPLKTYTNLLFFSKVNQFKYTPAQERKLQILRVGVILLDIFSWRRRGEAICGKISQETKYAWQLHLCPENSESRRQIIKWNR